MSTLTKRTQHYRVCEDQDAGQGGHPSSLPASNSRMGALSLSLSFCDCNIQKESALRLRRGMQVCLALIFPQLLLSRLSPLNEPDYLHLRADHLREVKTIKSQDKERIPLTTSV